MPSFKYTAKDASGKSVSGSIDAQSHSDALAALRKRNLMVLKVQGARQSRSKRGGSRMVRPGAKKGELELFTRQLSTMISAGIPLLECLEIQQEQAESPGFKKALEGVINDIRGGSDFSAALGQFPKVFSRIYVSMVKAGEASGQLDEILTRLAEYLEATAKLKLEIKSAMTYPVVSLVMVLGITFFLMIVIIPTCA